MPLIGAGQRVKLIMAGLGWAGGDSITLHEWPAPSVESHSTRTEHGPPRIIPTRPKTPHIDTDRNKPPPSPIPDARRQKMRKSD